jgi:hypothetical protein
MLIDIPSKEISQFVSIGMQNRDVASLKNGVSQLLLQDDLQSWIEKDATTNRGGFLPSNVGFSLSFTVEPACPGLVGLGSKLTKEPYNENDKELLDTLANNLVVAYPLNRSNY